MASLKITEDDIPDLTGKVAIITGGCSGIGLATAQILASKGATVHTLDLNSIKEDEASSNKESQFRDKIHYRHCNVADWLSLRQAFQEIGHVDIAVANAGVSQECDYFVDTYDEHGELEEPEYRVIDVNYRAVLNFIKLALCAFRKQGPGGSLVITSSATAYSPEQSLPVYSSTKLGLIGLVRALRSTVPALGATINAVAPAATITKLLPKDLAKPIIASGAPVSSAHHVGLAIAFSAVASQPHQVEGYGKDTPEVIECQGRWNGRVILTLGDKWTELEEPIADLRQQWFGKWNTDMTTFQQRLTDMR
ncbi:unnamed protein product [Penicillium glandicola]